MFSSFLFITLFENVFDRCDNTFITLLYFTFSLTIYEEKKTVLRINSSGELNCELHLFPEG